MKPLAPGQYRFQVTEVVAKSGGTITAGGEIRFAVVQSRARVPPSVAIESMVRLRVDPLGTRRLPLFETPGGRYIEMIKGEDRRRGTPVSLAFDQNGRRVDADRRLAHVEVARATKHGKVHEDLHQAVKEAGGEARVRVAVWLTTDPELPTWRLTIDTSIAWTV